MCDGERKWQPTLAFLPEILWTESLAGYSPWDHKSDTTEPLTHTLYVSAGLGRVGETEVVTGGTGELVRL